MSPVEEAGEAPAPGAHPQLPGKAGAPAGAPPGGDGCGPAGAAGADGGAGAAQEPPPGGGTSGAPSAATSTALAYAKLPARIAGRLSELADRHGLAAGQRDLLAVLLGLLEGEPTAPTSVREAERAVDIHIADSLSALDLEPVRRAERVADLGSGAGLPGLPLAVALPAAGFSLLESSSRKCRFLDLALQTTGLGNASAVCCRVEQWPDGHDTHDLVVARALASPPVVIEYAAPLLAVGGFLVDWRGHVSAEDEARALAAAAIVGLRREEVVKTVPFTDAAQHHLHLYVKVRDTPHRFPRRAGMARKRPLPA